MAKDKAGNIWFLSYSGLFKIDTARKITKIPLYEQELQKNNEFPSDIKIDKAGMYG